MKRNFSGFCNPNKRFLLVFCLGICLVIVLKLQNTALISKLNAVPNSTVDKFRLYATLSQQLAEVGADLLKLPHVPRITKQSVDRNGSQVFNMFKSGPLVLCPEVPYMLEGKVAIHNESLPEEFIERMHTELSLGGSWKPKRCTPGHKIAILVPYRDREEHLRIFLRHMHPFLQKQYLSYTIFVIEQTNFTPFNRGFLLNVGFTEATATDEYDCFFFHDVDLLPEDDRNLYTCPIYPRLMAVARSYSNYTLPYKEYFGGVTVMSKRHYLKINGHSNRFFGWGSEDDDVYNRINYQSLLIDRVPFELGRYRSLGHKKAQPSPQRQKVLEQNFKEEFREGLATTTYKLVKFEQKKLYTWILANPL